MANLLLSIPSPEKIRIAKNPDAYSNKLIHAIGISILWTSIGLIPFFSGGMELSNTWHSFMFLVVMAVPAGLLTWGITNYVKVRRGIEYEFDAALRTISLNGVLLYKFEEMREIRVERSEQQDEDGTTIFLTLYLVPGSGKKIKVETMTDPQALNNIVRSLFEVTGIPVIRKEIPQQIAFIKKDRKRN